MYHLYMKPSVSKDDMFVRGKQRFYQGYEYFEPPHVCIDLNDPCHSGFRSHAPTDLSGKIFLEGCGLLRSPTDGLLKFLCWRLPHPDKPRYRATDDMTFVHIQGEEVVERDGWRAVRSRLLRYSVFMFFDFLHMHRDDRYNYSCWDDKRCCYCGVPFGGCKLCKMEDDHIVPASLGGDNRKSNLVPACKRCNINKSNKNADEWMAASTDWLADHPCRDGCGTQPKEKTK